MHTIARSTIVGGYTLPYHTAAVDNLFERRLLVELGLVFSASDRKEAGGLSICLTSSAAVSGI